MRGAITLLAALVLTGSALAASAQKPVLKVKQATVQGTHFKANERVLVTLNGEKVFKRTYVRASAAGTFTIRLPFAQTHCGGFSISAVGEDGAHALAGMASACTPAVGGTKIPLRVPVPAP